MADYQLIVIGAGPGGYTAALRAAKLGLHTAVIEDRECGGTCLNRGCVPTKALLHASQVWSDAHHCAGVCADGASLDLPALYRHKDEISQTLSSGIEGLFRSAKVTLLRGRARITAPGCVEITGQDAGTVTAEHILIATGSVPARPPIPGLELAMTSDELLKGTDRLYRSIVIMGGGVIGVEFATFYSDLGCEVTVIEGLDRLLPGMDRELGQNLAQLLKKQGVRVFANSMVQRVEQGEDGLTVHFTTRGKEDFVTGEAVLSPSAAARTGRACSQTASSRRRTAAASIRMKTGRRAFPASMPSAMFRPRCSWPTSRRRRERLAWSGLRAARRASVWTLSPAASIAARRSPPSA